MTIVPSEWVSVCPSGLSLENVFHSCRPRSRRAYIQVKSGKIAYPLRRRALFVKLGGSKPIFMQILNITLLVSIIFKTSCDNCLNTYSFALFQPLGIWSHYKRIGCSFHTHFYSNIRLQTLSPLRSSVFFVYRNLPMIAHKSGRISSARQSPKSPSSHVKIILQPT